MSAEPRTLGLVVPVCAIYSTRLRNVLWSLPKGRCRSSNPHQVIRKKLDTPGDSEGNIESENVGNQR